jgi:GNAT superfamily N-acetyltransferase
MTDNITIRNAKFKDYKSICEMFAQANAEHCEMRPDFYRKMTKPITRWKYSLMLAARFLGHKRFSLQVAKQEGRNVGAVFVEYTKRSGLSWSAYKKEACLDNIVVVPDFRRKGVGTQLLENAKDVAIARGYPHMWGKIINENKTSLAFFEKAGFIADSTNVGLSLSIGTALKAA